ncbi:MAG TPA: ATP-binding protein [Candidatus Acidoferrales bacterium]|nr:ATP-binding protein [Candidatus Acidoferrales bacterium]
MRTSLFWKLGLTYLLLLLAVLVSVDFYAGRILRQNYIRAADEHLSSLAQLAKFPPPPLDDPKALGSWASRMSRSGARVTVIAFDGRVLADSAHDVETMENHSNRPEFIQAVADGEGESVRHSHTLDRDLVYWAMRFDRAAQPPVVIRFATPLAQITTALARVRRNLWGVSFLILLLGIAISLLFSRRFVKRVERLQAFSRRVAAGDFRPLPLEPAHDELGDLTEALNDTASHLSATILSLTEERNRSAAILRSMAEGIAVVDARERVTFCNDAFKKIWNIGSMDIEGRPAVEVIRHPDILALIHRALEGGEVLHGEISSGSANPRSFSVTVAPIPVFDDPVVAPKPQQKSTPFGAVVVLHEITDLRRLEQVRKDFVANVSHELRTPLTAIQGFAETLLTGALEDQQNNRHFVEIIRDHAARLSRLTDDLLKLSRIEAGKLDMDFQAVDMGVLIEASVESSRNAATQKKLSLVPANVPANFPRVLGDANLLREVLRNLLDNAIQYTPAGGRIQIDVATKESYAIITVTDTGIGIPQADQSRIFERFYRVDAARSREVGGTGLGLAIAKHVVEAHGGEIWVESTVGEGSKFYFTVPLT